MKKILTLIAIATIALIGCRNPSPAPTPEPPTPEKPSGKLDPNARIYINSAQAPQSAPSQMPTLTEGDKQVKLTPLEMLLGTNELISTKANIGIGGENKDTTNVRFIIPSIWAIDQDGALDPQFIESRDYLFIDHGENLEKFDTIGYVRNELLIKAEREIKAAYAAENYTECYRLLQETFEFTPTTGAEYRELQAQGLN